MSQSVADKLLLSANEESLAVSNFHPDYGDPSSQRQATACISFSNAFDMFCCCG